MARHGFAFQAKKLQVRASALLQVCFLASLGVTDEIGTLHDEYCHCSCATHTAEPSVRPSVCGGRCEEAVVVGFNQGALQRDYSLCPYMSHPAEQIGVSTAVSGPRVCSNFSAFLP